jgi:hypothetical protein
MPNSFKRYFSRGVGLANTTVGSYTSPASTNTTIIGLTLANIDAGDITVSVMHNDGSANTYVAKDTPVTAGETFVVVGGDQKIVLQEGDGINVSSNTAASVDVVMSVLEIT